MKKIFSAAVLMAISMPVLASRSYVGMAPISEIRLVESSTYCGVAAGECLILYFEGGAAGCNPASEYLAIRLNEPNIELIQSMALVSFTSKKKFRTYATNESCADADLLNPNGVSVYDTPH